MPISARRGWPLWWSRWAAEARSTSVGFGAYSTHELGITPEDYDTRLDVDFSVLEDDQVPAAA
ncbi:hypothetical protein AB0K09_03465 [Streptomyces sp. NPDC049577]|uniref:hypothetical protein n=1 Tax=Streptomyces sp. NPDC049577 TaxID=3155153 RepID=UPI0034323529